MRTIFRAYRDSCSKAFGVLRLQKYLIVMSFEGNSHHFLSDFEIITWIFESESAIWRDKFFSCTTSGYKESAYDTRNECYREQAS